jgi:hypothetical protein
MRAEKALATSQGIRGISRAKPWLVGKFSWTRKRGGALNEGDVGLGTATLVNAVSPCVPAIVRMIASKPTPGA